MPRNDDGEFILELGHRQLLSVFFIVVILLGVSFTMGYIVGRNSAPTAAAVATPQRPAAEPSGTAFPGSSTAPSAVGETAPANEPPLAPGQVMVNQPVPSTTGTVPARPPATTAEPPAAVPVAPRPAPTTTAPVAAVKEKEKAPVVDDRKAANLHGEALPGHTYLQVVAVKKPDAEMIASILRKNGFSQAIVVPGPNEVLFRVLVGPLKDAAALSKTKMDLDAAGFKSMARKY
jgi:cell division protein FtsN